MRPRLDTRDLEPQGWHHEVVEQLERLRDLHAGRHLRLYRTRYGTTNQLPRQAIACASHLAAVADVLVLHSNLRTTTPKRPYNLIISTDSDFKMAVYVKEKVRRQAGFDFVTIGERLRAFRIAADLRAEDVAKRLGISRAAVYKLERGEIVKIETLDRLSALLGTSLTNLLGLEVEYHAAAVSYFERMRQLESRSVRILAHFDPISYLLTSDDYDRYLRLMLNESIPESLADDSWRATVDSVLNILLDRKMAFARSRPNVESLIGLRQLEQFLHHGLVGRLGLPPGEQLERKVAARREVAKIVELLKSEPLGIRIGIVSDNIPSHTFQIFEEAQQVRVAVSPFRLGELPNIRSGIATITSSPDAVAMYRELIEHLWRGAAKGADGARLLEELLARC